MMLKCNAQIAGLLRTDSTAPGARRRRDGPNQIPWNAALSGIEHDAIMSCRLTG
jgi:hypothetical protein